MPASGRGPPHWASDPIQWRRSVDPRERLLVTRRRRPERVGVVLQRGGRGRAGRDSATAVMGDPITGYVESCVFKHDFYLCSVDQLINSFARASSSHRRIPLFASEGQAHAVERHRSQPRRVGGDAGGVQRRPKAVFFLEDLAKGSKPRRDLVHDLAMARAQGVARLLADARRFAVDDHRLQGSHEWEVSGALPLLQVRPGSVARWQSQSRVSTSRRVCPPHPPRQQTGKSIAFPVWLIVSDGEGGTFVRSPFIRHED